MNEGQLNCEISLKANKLVADIIQETPTAQCRRIVANLIQSEDQCNALIRVLCACAIMDKIHYLEHPEDNHLSHSEHLARSAFWVAGLRLIMATKDREGE